MRLVDGRSATLREVVFKDSEALQRVEAAIVRAGVGVVMTPDEIRDVRSVMDRVGAILDAGDLLLVAELDGEIVGSVDVRRIGVTGLRHNASLTMGLVPAAQGLGLGRALLHAALDWSREQGIARLELACLADNPRALAMYEAAGFVRTHVRTAFLRWPDGREVDDVMMERLLGGPVDLTRPEQPDDIEAIHAIHAAAFESPGEAHLVDALRDAEAHTHSRVLTRDGEVVAHVLLSPVTHHPDAGVATEGVVGLAPIAVRPDLQGKGLGNQLMRETLASLHRRAVPAVVLLGDPAYYERFGFVAAADHGLRWTREVPPGAFQLLPLRGVPSAGELRYHPLIEAL